ncbi:MAG TPA: phospholipid carrier-dependent glycosyltransferase [Anaerolineales bacterium]|jgi:4-amino-4-deoxy-L-arabinose transferase-like glycosyltransferase
MAARYSRYYFYFFLAILSLGAMDLLYISTPAGAGLANDSVAYIAGARSILQGKGYTDIWLDSSLEPITHYPPLLSLALAGFGLLGIDPLRGARILNILVYGANTGLLGILGWRMSRSQVAGLWLTALFVLNASLLRVHVFALSEPLFLFLSLLAFLFFDLSLARPASELHSSISKAVRARKTVWLVLAGVTCGLAFLTRYSALALLPTFILAMFLYQREGSNANSGINTWRAKLTRTILFLAGAIPPMAAWFLRNKLTAGNTTNRTFQLHPVGAENILPGLYNVSQFLMPIEPWRQALVKNGLVGWGIAGLGLGLFIWLAFGTRNLLFDRGGNKPQPLTYVTGLYVFGYFGAVLFSMSFFDASTKFQPRILAPLYVSGLALMVVFSTWLWRQNQRIQQGFVILLAVITLTISVYGLAQAVVEFKTAGQGYASWKWHDSLVMASLRELPAGTAIYTNTPPAVYLVTGRATRTLPTPIDPVDNLPRAEYQKDLAQMRSDLLSGRAVLALFDTSLEEETNSAQEIGDFSTGLKLLQKTQGDALYGKP